MTVSASREFPSVNTVWDIPGSVPKATPELCSTDRGLSADLLNLTAVPQCGRTRARGGLVAESVSRTTRHPGGSHELFRVSGADAVAAHVTARQQIPMRTSATRVRAFAILVPILSIAFCLLAMEGGLRLAIFSDTLGIAKLKEPRHYADSWLDDDYWKLDYILNEFAQAKWRSRAGTNRVRNAPAARVGSEDHRRESARYRDRPAV